MGLKLLSRGICDIQSGKIVRKSQDERFATFEPSTEIEQLYRPDLLMLPGAKVNGYNIKSDPNNYELKIKDIENKTYYPQQQ